MKFSLITKMNWKSHEKIKNVLTSEIFRTGLGKSSKFKKSCLKYLIPKNEQISLILFFNFTFKLIVVLLTLIYCICEFNRVNIKFFHRYENYKHIKMHNFYLNLGSVVGQVAHHHVKPLDRESNLLELAFCHGIVDSSGVNVVLKPNFI